MKYFSVLIFLSTIVLLQGCHDHCPYCKHMAKYCTKPLTKPFMELLCPVTCHSCTPTTIITTVPTSIGPCIMDKCPTGYTCMDDVCTLSSNSIAIDNDKDNCNDKVIYCRRIRKFCKQNWQDSFMAKNCAKTCRFCKVNDDSENEQLNENNYYIVQ